MKKNINSVLNALNSETSKQKTFEKSGTAKIGRKKLPKEEKRNNRVVLQFTQAEFEELQNLANLEFENITLFIRKIVLKSIKKI